MDELAEWLTNVLDEIERVALAVIETAEWVARGNEVVEVFGVAGPPDQVCRTTDGTDAAHIALHDPRAALARVEAERRLLTLHGPVPGELSSTCFEVIDHEAVEVPACPKCAEPWPCATLRVLAYGHRFDANGYDPAWTPEGVSEPAG